MDSTRLYSLIAQLDSEVEEERLEAVSGLGLRDKRAIPYLVRVLRNQAESPRVRGRAAELLRFSNKKRTIVKALVECSADASAEVRFWCVYALGHFVGRRKTPLIVVRALEERLGDTACPDAYGNWWPVGLEALAALRTCKKSRFPVGQTFKETILKVMRDPLNHSGHWRWADCYWVDSIADSPALGRALYDGALQKISEAGFEPVTFGRTAKEACQ